MAIAASGLLVYIYVFVPVALLFTILALLYFGVLMGSVHGRSKESIFGMKRGVPQLVDADRRVVQYATRLIRAQRPFGFQMGDFGYASVNTAQGVITEAISNSLLFISMA